MADDSILVDREVGQLEIAIGTSLAIEGALGIYPDAPVTPAPIKKYTELWLNVSTMIRNIHGSVSTDMQNLILTEDLLDCLVTEMNMLQGAMVDKMGDNFKVVYYYNDLVSIRAKHPNATFKYPTTDRQKIYAGLEEHVIQVLPEYLDGIDYRVFNGKIYGAGDTLIITHRVYDLLSLFQFSKLSLLESHTGRIKERHEWGSKLGPKDDSIPFNIFTLQVFGDRNVDFTPISIKYRRVLVELAKTKRWTSLTGIEKIKMDIRSLDNPEAKEIFLSLF